MTSKLTFLTDLVVDIHNEIRREDIKMNVVADGNKIDNLRRFVIETDDMTVDITATEDGGLRITNISDFGAGFLQQFQAENCCVLYPAKIFRLENRKKNLTEK